MLVAARAGTAARKADDDRVAHAQPFDAFADRLDHPGAFMAEAARQRERCELVAEDEIGMTKADASYLHAHFARARCFDLDRLEGERAAGLAHHRRRRFGHSRAPFPAPGAAMKSPLAARLRAEAWVRSEEHTSELQSLMRISYAVFCLKKKKQTN